MTLCLIRVHRMALAAISTLPSSMLRYECSLNHLALPASFPPVSSLDSRNEIAMELQLNNSIGCYLMGVIMAAPYEAIFAWLSVSMLTACTTRLYGITCAQVMYYFQHYSSDSIKIKALVSHSYFHELSFECSWCMQVIFLWSVIFLISPRYLTSICS